MTTLPSAVVARLEAHAALHQKLAADQGDAVLRWLGFGPPARIRTALDDTDYLETVASYCARQAAHDGQLALDLQAAVALLLSPGISGDHA